MPLTIQLTDPVYKARKKDNFLSSFLVKFINDKRDLPFLLLTLKISLVILPAALYILISKEANWIVYGIYLALIVVFLGPYTLMLHNTCHRKLFRKKYNWMIHYVHWVLGGFFGQTPETYFYHHVAMHHVENNLAGDISSTLPFRRDSLRAFLRYLMEFYLCGIYQLVNYFRKKKRFSFAAKVSAGEFIYLAIITALCFYNLNGTLVVYILPFFFTRFAMMSGNWAQHAFICSEQPENIYRNSITCINTGYNRKCFNDGYHIGHHLRPAMHWTEMPDNFLQNLEQYRVNNAVVFRGLDYFQIWFLLMTKNYRKLSDHFVCLEEQPRSEKDIMELLKMRTGRAS